MISKQHKLTTKEVNYLLRRRQAVYAWWYKLLHCDQYSNNAYHQTGIQVSGKIHKHAVQRNIIRRAYYAAREDMIDKAVHNRYYKVFLIVHPEHCEFINQVRGQRWATANTREGAEVRGRTKLALNQSTNQTIHQQLKQHFSTIIRSSLWNINHSPSNTPGNRSKASGRRSP